MLQQGNTATLPVPVTGACCLVLIGVQQEAAVWWLACTLDPRLLGPVFHTCLYSVYS